ncbi:MAG: methyltransferase domain-containing protein [Rhodothermales bacterium]
MIDLSTTEPWDTVASGFDEFLRPAFASYASHAINLSGLVGGDRVLDIATGPGTLALQVASSASFVSALDFSPLMLERLRRNLQDAAVGNVEVVLGDAQALPFADCSFDYAFSMFGLMFCPDRAAAFREMRRVLRPGGTGVVTSWTKRTQIPLMDLIARVVSARNPLVRDGSGESNVPTLPLENPNELRREMIEGGFRDVSVSQASFEFSYPDVATYWQANLVCSAPLSVVKRAILGESSLGQAAWQAFVAEVESDLVAELGASPIRYRWSANFARAEAS